MVRFFDVSDRLFDFIKEAWESNFNRCFIGLLLVLVYFVSLLLIALKRHDLLPQALSAMAPKSYLYAINYAFTFLLYIEVIDLVFGLARSFSKAVGKQFQIFSLILLRQSFKEFSYLSEPLQWPPSNEPVFYILANAGGALVMFAVISLYYQMIYHQPITCDGKEEASFISLKKLIALLLLAIFNISGVYYAFFNISGIYYAFAALQNGHAGNFFGTFYTVLVFSDILIVLLSLRYSHSYPVVFRNSGFALATVLLRLALTAPHYYNALLGVVAALFVLALKIIYNRFVPACSLPSAAGQ